MKNVALCSLIALAAVGCASENNFSSDLLDFPDSKPKAPENPTVTDRIVQVTTPKVDVLFVVDNSCSMGPFQTLLSEEFPAFMRTFDNSGLDYHIGVTSTDTTTDPSDRCYSSRAPGLNGRLNRYQGLLWIDENTPDPVLIFSGMAVLGSDGSGCEKGLGAAYRALEDQWEYNAGFYREDAAIHTIIVSDEEDQTEDDNPPVITLREFENWYDGLKDDVEARTFSSIVCTEAGSNNGASCSTFNIGDRYMQVTDSIGGLTWDILDENFGVLLDELGLLAAGLKVEYFLSNVPVPETIEVSVITPAGGVTFKEQGTEEEGGDYIFDDVRNAIVFHTFVPEPLDQVEITYTPLAAVQDPSFEVSDAGTEVPE
jgi:hypothetical protein